MEVDDCALGHDISLLLPKHNIHLAQSKVEKIIKHRIVGALLRYVRLYELVVRMGNCRSVECRGGHIGRAASIDVQPSTYLEHTVDLQPLRP
jgi:hypothetical protein